MIENLMTVEVPSAASDSSAGDSEVSEFTECNSTSGVETADIIRTGNEQTCMVSQAKDTKQDELVEDMASMYHRLAIQENEAKEMRMVMKTLQAQIDQQMKYLSQQTKAFENHRHFMEQVLSQQNEQIKALTQAMMSHSQSQITMEQNDLHGKVMGDIGPTTMTMRGSANE
jgi:hypothetical protein